MAVVFFRLKLKYTLEYDTVTALEMFIILQNIITDYKIIKISPVAPW